MKRTDLEVGRAYAQLSPSQHIGRSRALRVIVLDTEPMSLERYATPRTERVDVTYVDAATGKNVTVNAVDYTRGSRSADAKRSVKVLHVEKWGSEDHYSITVAPLSQVRMLWADYVQQRTAAQERDRESHARLQTARDAANEHTQNALALAQELGIDGFAVEWSSGLQRVVLDGMTALAVLREVQVRRTLTDAQDAAAPAGLVHRDGCTRLHDAINWCRTADAEVNA